MKNIWCVGRNYLEHAKELGNPVPPEPLIFLKAGSTLVPNGALIHLPSWAGEVHYELELALFLDINLEPTHGALALDLTARDVQARLKKSGQPWTLAKSFKESCPLGSLFEIPDLSQLQEKGSMALRVNGELRQSGEFKDMIFPMKDLLSYLKEHFPLSPGDLILTGTPSGVGALKKGDQLQAFYNEKLQGSWSVA